MSLRGLASLKSAGQVGRLEMRVRVDAASRGRRLGTEAELLCCGLEAEFFLLWKTSVFALKASNWLDEAHSYSGGVICFT